MVEVGSGLSSQDPIFQSYYNEIKVNLETKAPVVGVIGYYDFPWQQDRMISDDGTLVLLFATIAGSTTSEKIHKIVSTTPAKKWAMKFLRAWRRLSLEVCRFFLYYWYLALVVASPV